MSTQKSTLKGLAKLVLNQKIGGRTFKAACKVSHEVTIQGVVNNYPTENLEEQPNDDRIDALFQARFNLTLDEFIEKYDEFKLHYIPNEVNTLFHI